MRESEETTSPSTSWGARLRDASQNTDEVTSFRLRNDSGTTAFARAQEVVRTDSTVDRVFLGGSRLGTRTFDGHVTL